VERGEEAEVPVRDATRVLGGMGRWVRGRSWEEEVALEELVARRWGGGEIWGRRRGREEVEEAVGGWREARPGGVHGVLRRGGRSRRSFLTFF
jgi:hypothetical protein